MSSNGPQKGDQYGSYRYNDNGIIQIGMLISIPGQEDEFFVRDFIDLIPEDQPAQWLPGRFLLTQNLGRIPPHQRKVFKFTECTN
jgi:hypothetical protein